MEAEAGLQAAIAEQQREEEGLARIECGDGCDLMFDNDTTSETVDASLAVATP